MFGSIRDMRVGTKLALLVGVAVLGLTAFGVFSYATLNAVKVNGPSYKSIVQGKDLIADILPPPEYIIESYLVVLQMVDETDHDTLAALVKRGQTLRDEYDTRHEFWINDLPEGRMKDVLVVDSYKPAIEFFEIRDREFIPAALSGDRESANEIARGALKDQYAEHRAAIDQVVAMATERNMEVELAAARLISSRTWMLIGLGVGIAAAISALCMLLVRQITRPLASVVSMARAVAEGDINQTLSVQSRDEVGMVGTAFLGIVSYMQDMAGAVRRIADGDLTLTVTPRSSKDALGSAMSQMASNVRNLVGQVSTTANNLSQSSALLAAAAEQAGQATQDIAQASQQVAKGAGEQAQSIQQTTSAIKQLSNAIDQIAKGGREQSRSIEQASLVVNQVSSAIAEVAHSAQAAATGSSQASEAASNGRNMVNRSVEGMSRIKTAVEAASSQIAELGTQSEEIGKIVAVIDDIAAQTNLLALNAAIEAARAGEQGRGFAVVADEVRGLAERVTEATKEIAGLISNIQKGVAQSVKAAEDGTKEVEQGVRLAQEAGNALNEIMESVESVSQQIGQISAAAEEVSASSDEMVKSIDSVSSVVEENTTATQQMAANSGGVARAVEGIAAIAQENSAATQQTSSSAVEVTAQVQEVVASAQTLSQMAQQLQRAISAFKLAESARPLTSFRH